MHLPSAGRALPSHYIGSAANHRLAVCLSRLISLFSFPSSTGDRSLSFSPTAALPYLPTVCLNHFLLWHVLYLPLFSCQSTFFSSPPPSSPLSHSSVCPPSLLSPLIFSGAHLTDCTLCPSSHFCFLVVSPPPTLSSLAVKDLDTEKYVHLVSISSSVITLFPISTLLVLLVSQRGAGLATGGWGVGGGGGEWR